MRRSLALALAVFLGGGEAANAGCAIGLIGSVNLSASATGAASTVSASITTSSGTLTYLTRIMVSGGGATAASVVNGTITGVVGAPLNFAVPVPAGATAGLTPVILDFSSCPLQGSTVNGTITVSVPSFGAGNTLADLTITGF